MVTGASWQGFLCSGAFAHGLGAHGWGEYVQLSGGGQGRFCSHSFGGQ